MSLVVALKVRTGEVVLAADRRGTYGDPRELVAVDDNLSKIQPYGCGAFGIADCIGQVLMPVLATKAMLPKDSDATTIVQVLAVSLKEHYHTYYSAVKWFRLKTEIDTRPNATMIFVDPKPVGDSTGLYVFDSKEDFAPRLEPRPFAFLGTPQYAFYLYQRLWREDFSVGEAQHLAAFLITETAALEPKVGCTIDMLIVGSERVASTSAEDVKRILSKNSERSTLFAGLFRD